MRPDLPPLPERMKGQKEDERGFPVPWFVKWHEGKPIFQAADGVKWDRAVKYQLCWLCGKRLGAIHAFVIGPMCGINRYTAEPPSHRECAEFALRACPFLTRPMAKRTDPKVTIPKRNPGGEMIERNPGVSLLWMTRSWKVAKVPNGYLISLGGPPQECVFWREGRMATKAEVLDAVATGMPLLTLAAEKNGEPALRELARMVGEFSTLLDATFDGTANG